jgi:hypothetical protein
VHSRELLTAAADHAADFLETLPDARVDADVRDAGALREALAVPLTDDGVDPRVVLDELVAAASPGIVRSQSPRYFGYVIGGALPAAMAADFVAVAWDQNAAGFAVSPGAAVAEEVAGGWLAELLGLPATASFGLTTGCRWRASRAWRRPGTRCWRARAGMPTRAGCRARRGSGSWSARSATSRSIAPRGCSASGPTRSRRSASTRAGGWIRPTCARCSRATTG